METLSLCFIVHIYCKMRHFNISVFTLSACFKYSSVTQKPMRVHFNGKRGATAFVIVFLIFDKVQKYTLKFTSIV